MNQMLRPARTCRPSPGPVDPWSNRWHRPSGAVLVAAASAVLVLPTGLAAVSLPVLMVLLARQLPGPTTARRLALTVPVLLGANAGVLTLLSVAGTRADARWIVAAYLVLLVAAEGRRSADTRPVPLSDGTDAWAGITAAVTFLLLFRPFAGASVERLSALLSRSTDGGTHISLVRAVLREGGYVGLLPSAPGTMPGLVNYPSGWHGSTAGLVQVLLGSDADLRALLTVVSLSVIGLCALIAHLTVATALDLAHAVSGRVTPAGAAAAIACTLLTVVAGATALLPASSSFAQIAATAVLLASTCVAVTATRGDGRPTAVLAVLAVGLFHTWFLLAPVLAAVMLVHLAAQRPPLRAVFGWGVPAVLLAAYPILNGPDPGAQVLAVGSTHPLSGDGVLALMVSTVISLVVLLVGSHAGRAARLTVTGSLVACMLLAAGVLTIQVAGGGGTYYTLKLLYTAFTLSAVAASAVLATTLSPEHRPTGPGRVVPAVLAVVVLGGFAVGSATVREVTVDQLSGSGSGLPDERVLGAALARGGQRAEGVDVWIVGACSRLEDRRASQFVNSVQLVWDESLLEAFNAFLNADADDLSMVADRARDPRVERVEVYVHGDCRPTGLRALAALPKVEVIEV